MNAQPFEETMLPALVCLAGIPDARTKGIPLEREVAYQQEGAHCTQALWRGQGYWHGSVPRASLFC